MLYLMQIIMILLLITVTITDLARRDIDFIPLIISFIFIIIFNSMGYNVINIKESLIGGIIFYILFRVLPNMGQGDARLFGIIGLFYGFNKTFFIMYVFLIVVLVCCSILIITKIKSRKDYIPLAPYIFMAVLISMIWFPNGSIQLLWL